MSSQRVLITGGTGFIGAALALRLARDGFTIRIFDNDSRGAVRRLGELASVAELVSGDIRDSAAVVAAAKGVDAVWHLAFVNGTANFYRIPDVVLDVGVRGMLNVMDACAKWDVGELFLASSSEVYQTPPAVPTDESAPLSIPDPCNPRFSYGGGKIISELLAIHCAGRRMRRVVIFRPHNVYGPDMGWDHVIPQFIARAARLPASDGPVDFPIQGTGGETRAFSYIDDVADALAILARRGEHLRIYHVGTDVETSIAALAQEVGNCLGRRLRLTPGQLTAGSTARRCPDISRIRSLGFSPRVTLAEGLRRSAPWYLEHLADDRSGA